MNDPLITVSRYAAKYLEELPNLAVTTPIDRRELFSRFQDDLPETGTSAGEVVSRLIADCQAGIIHSAGGRFFGWVIGGHVPSSLAADWLTSLWDQNAALYASAPSAAIVEEIAGKWLKQLLHIPENASFAFTTGCQMAHFTCLAAARHGVLASSGWDVEKNGLNGAPPVRILTSRLLHATAVRAIRYLGFGTNAIEYLSSDKEGRLLPDALQTALKDNKQPAIVILQAGDVNTGAFDDFEALIEIAHERNAWVHIDGAFGLWAATSEQYKHLVKGCEKADSWAADGHKWLNVPYDSGYAFVRDSSAHFETFSIRASYLIHSDDARDQMDWTPEWSRRARGFATYAAIRELGKNGISEIVENCCRLARLLTEELGKIKGVEIVSHSKINQSLVRFIPAKKNPAAHEVDAFTDFVISENLKRGASFFGGTSWNGSRCMRISVSNWRTNQDDIAETVDVFKEIMDEYGVAG